MKTKAQNSKFQTPNTSRGITLVALVVTIVVLLILAGVAINMAINSDGLFGKANEATEEWNTSVKEEQTAIGGLLTDLDKISPTPVTVSTTLPEGWDSNKISAVAQGLGGKAPIPVGFVVSEIAGENTIGNGLVIYQVDKTTSEATGFWTAKGEDGYLTCQTGYNQYVWIPVLDINQMVMCKSNTANSVCNLQLTGGTLKCTVHATTATELCGRLYAAEATTTDEKIYTTSMNFENRSQTWEANGRREPDILEGTDTDANTGNLATFTTNITNDFTAMATSVAKYGGFYVGRYEAGANGESKKKQKVLVAGTQLSGVYPSTDGNAITATSNGSGWYGLYNTLRDTTPTGVALHMIYGSQYDQIINFIGKEAQIGHITRQLAAQKLTGTNEKEVMSNIYDLEGNNFEFTAEVYEYEVTSNSTTTAYLQRVNRGSAIVNASGSFLPASYRGYFPPSSAICFYGARGVLYVTI